MGEIADMLLGGQLCEGCGCELENEEPMGIPDYCSVSCAKDRGAEWWIEAQRNQ